MKQFSTTESPHHDIVPKKLISNFNPTSTLLALTWHKRNISSADFDIKTAFQTSTYTVAKAQSQPRFLLWVIYTKSNNIFQVPASVFSPDLHISVSRTSRDGCNQSINPPDKPPTSASEIKTKAKPNQERA
jgi:hypothetical protein